jgi:hypothetical protein
MRLTGLLALLLFLAIVFFAAPAASYAQTTDSSAVTLPLPANTTVMPATVPPAHFTRRSFTEERRDGVCYTMRTYIMARENPDSDATYLKGYRECLPEWKVQMRSTEATVPTPPLQ